MASTLQLSEQFSACGAPLRVDVYGSTPREHVLDDLSFLNYRLADVVISPDVTVATPDIVWQSDGAKGVSYDGSTLTFTGDWPAGPLQKAIVTMLTLRLEERGLTHWADPEARQPGEVNHDDGGRGMYFRDPDGHWLEVITVRYGGRPTQLS